MSAAMPMPPELKQLKRFFKRAEELDRAAAKGHAKSASVAYFCRSYAPISGIDLLLLILRLLFLLCPHHQDAHHCYMSQASLKIQAR